MAYIRNNNNYKYNNYTAAFSHLLRTLLSFYCGHLPSQQYCQQYSRQQESPTLDRDNNHSHKCGRRRQYRDMTTAWTVNSDNLLLSQWLYLYILVWEGGVKTKWLHYYLANNMYKLVKIPVGYYTQ